MGLKELKPVDRINFLKLFVGELIISLGEQDPSRKIEVEKIRQKFLNQLKPPEKALEAAVLVFDNLVYSKSIGLTPDKGADILATEKKEGKKAPEMPKEDDAEKDAAENIAETHLVDALSKNKGDNESPEIVPVPAQNPPVPRKKIHFSFAGNRNSINELRKPIFPKRRNAPQHPYINSMPVQYRHVQKQEHSSDAAIYRPQPSLPEHTSQVSQRSPVSKEIIMQPFIVSGQSARSSYFKKPVPKGNGISDSAMGSAGPPDSWLGKIGPILNDLSIQAIECRGPGKNILVKRYNKVKVTKIALTNGEIEALINSFSQRARIPVVGGILKAAVGDLIISAVSSEYAGSRFIISKIIPHSSFEGPMY